MRLWHILGSRVRSLVLRGRREADLNEELQLHIDRETERLQASGPQRPRDTRRFARSAASSRSRKCAEMLEARGPL